LPVTSARFVRSSRSNKESMCHEKHLRHRQYMQSTATCDQKNGSACTGNDDRMITVAHTREIEAGVHAERQIRRR